VGARVDAREDVDLLDVEQAFGWTILYLPRTPPRSLT